MTHFPELLWTLGAVAMSFAAGWRMRGNALHRANRRAYEGRRWRDSYDK